MWLDCYDIAERIHELGIGLVVRNAPNVIAEEVTYPSKLEFEIRIRILIRNREYPL